MLRDTPSLRDIARLIKKLEARYAVEFDRSTAVIRTSMLDSVAKIRGWVGTL